MPFEFRGGTELPFEFRGGTELPFEFRGGTELPFEFRGGTELPFRADLKKNVKLPLEVLPKFLSLCSDKICSKFILY